MGGMRGTKKRLGILKSKWDKRTIPYGREPYLAYLRSDAWRKVKLRYFASRLPKCCYVCKAPWRDDFVFHHKTYKNLGRERLMDIGPMCRDCHDALHWGHKQRRMNLWAASKQKTVMKMKERRDAARVPPV
jgi:hypothetical protein